MKELPTLRAGGDDMTDEAFRSRLEDELIERHGRLYGIRGSTSVARPTWFRSAGLVAAAILMATVAVAAVPIHLTLGLAHVVTIDLPAGTPAPDHRDLLLHLLDARSGAEQASASVDSNADGAHRVLLLMFGEHIDAERARTDLEQAFPTLSAGQWSTHALEADLRTSIARALGYRLLAFEPDHRALESRRQVILDHLARQGWRADVTFDPKEGIRIIEVASDEGPRPAGR